MIAVIFLGLITSAVGIGIGHNINGAFVAGVGLGLVLVGAFYELVVAIRQERR